MLLTHFSTSRSLAFLLATLFAPMVSNGLAETFEARVVSVADGDTITAIDSSKQQH